ncbi:MAG: archaemetzincin family Zn-dependent metalloprotease [Candidatus Thermoplasmatota archaeon]|nr:archaemetzincin family Zn-dependent metalloprotease [Candidatus Thermoplasmatota archaeon]
MQVSLVPLGPLPKETIAGLDTDLRTAGVGVTVLPSQEIPKEAYDAPRRQYRAPDLLEIARWGHGEHVLLVTDVDLYVEPLNFVFGQADVGGQAAVISLHRLGSEDLVLFRRRTLKEALHELGHNVGLEHCAEETCVMYFSNGLPDTDRKGPNLCAACARSLGKDPPWNLPG